jgi:hypothetical protein
MARFVKSYHMIILFFYLICARSLLKDNVIFLFGIIILFFSAVAQDDKSIHITIM